MTGFHEDASTHPMLASSALPLPAADPRAGAAAPGTAAGTASTARPERRGPSRYALIHVAIVAILVADTLTPAGIVVGILLVVPVLLTSFENDERRIWLAVGVALVGKVLAAIFGFPAISPAAVWVPNRVFAFLALIASGPFALVLQRRRMEAEHARDAAIRMRELNRLLMSLLAHDLRSPLTLANEGIIYVETAVAREQTIDTRLLRDVRARLRRSLRALEVILTVAKAESARVSAGSGAESSADATAARSTVRSTSRLRVELAAEVAAFEHEAMERRKKLVAELDALPDDEYLVDVLVVRQALAILLDNAIRYSAPGIIRVSAADLDGTLVLRVTDPGPATAPPSAWGESAATRGLGLGLELCRALVAHAGGGLADRSDATGTVFEARLPITRVAAAPAGATA